MIGISMSMAAILFCILVTSCWLVGFWLMVRCVSEEYLRQTGEQADALAIIFVKLCTKMNEILLALLFRLEIARDYRDILSNWIYFSVETCKKDASKIGCCVLISRGEYSRNYFS